MLVIIQPFWHAMALSLWVFDEEAGSMRDDAHKSKMSSQLSAMIKFMKIFW